MRHPAASGLMILLFYVQLCSHPARQKILQLYSEFSLVKRTSKLVTYILKILESVPGQNINENVQNLGCKETLQE